MNLTLKVSYHAKWLGTICSFVRETAQAHGAEDSICSALHLAAEETALHIIESIPHDDAEDAFEVICRPHSNGLEYEFKNIGPPVNIEDIPDYDSNAPDESSLESLRLFLAKKMVDRLEFINLGRQGWKTCFFKRFESKEDPEAEAREKEEVFDPNIAISTTRATPSDAFAIVKMAYMNYRYSYAKEAFYFAEILEEELASGRTVSFIAQTETKQIIGHLAFIQEKQNPNFIEVGAVMIRPEYRRSRGLFSLIKSVLRYRDQGLPPESLIYSYLVTAHSISQKLAQTMGMKPLAFRLSTHPRARFLGMDSMEGRESNLYAVYQHKNATPLTVFLPKEHREISLELLENLGTPYQIKESVPNQSSPTAIQWHTRYDPHSQYAVLSADSYGEDFANSLRQMVIHLSQDRIDTLTIHLPTWIPLPPDLDEKMKERAFLFCGYVFAEKGKLYLTYTRLINHRFTFSDIQTHDPMATKLRDHISNLHQEIYQPAACRT